MEGWVIVLHDQTLVTLVWTEGEEVAGAIICQLHEHFFPYA